jgi:hypothetical protein
LANVVFIPLIDVPADKMLRFARKSDSTGRTAAS